MLPFVTFYFLSLWPNYNIVSYADGKTLYSSGKILHIALLDLEKKSDFLLKWFAEKYLKANLEKYYVVLSTNNNLFLEIQELSISSGRREKLLGIKIDHYLSFELHIESLFKKASRSHKLLYLQDLNKGKYYLALS